MSLQEIKREVHSLPSIKDEVHKFKQNWVKPIRKNTNQHLPFLNQLSTEAKKEFNSLLEQANMHISEIKDSQIIHDKLQAYARQLIELKLSTIQDNHHKTK